MLVNRGHNKLVIWFNPNRNIYYYRLIRGFYNNYVVGNKNQYDHVIVLVIDLEYEKQRTSIRKRLIRRFISFLEKIE